MLTCWSSPSTAPAALDARWSDALTSAAINPSGTIARKNTTLTFVRIYSKVKAEANNKQETGARQRNTQIRELGVGRPVTIL